MKRIVVAEDTEPTRKGITRMLIQARYEVSPTCNGQEALDCILNGGLFDLLMTDVNMPEKTGFELVNELGERGYTLPVLVSSTFVDISSLVYGGRIDLLSKPYDTRDLVPAVERIIGTSDGLRRIIDTSDIDLDAPLTKCYLDRDLKKMDHLRDLPEGVDAYSVKVMPSDEEHKFVFEVQYGNIVGKEFVPEGEPVMYQSEGLPII
jgi:CheY-like chemotaxis protein